MEVKASVKFCYDLGDAKAYEIPERDTTKRRFEKLMEEYKESVEVAEKARHECNSTFLRVSLHRNAVFKKWRSAGSV